MHQDRLYQESKISVRMEHRQVHKMWGMQMSEKRATSVETIVRDIIDLTDTLHTTEELGEAWSRIYKAVNYLSAKDSMLKYRRELKEE